MGNAVITEGGDRIEDGTPFMFDDPAKNTAKNCKTDECNPAKII